MILLYKMVPDVFTALPPTTSFHPLKCIISSTLLFTSFFSPNHKKWFCALFSPVVVDLVSSILMISLTRLPYGSGDGGSSYMFQCSFTWSGWCAYICECLCFFASISLPLQAHSIPACSPQEDSAMQFISTENGVKTQTEGAAAPGEYWMPFGSLQQSASTSDLICFSAPFTTKLSQPKLTSQKHGDSVLNPNLLVHEFEFRTVLIFHHFFLKVKRLPLNIM